MGPVNRPLDMEWLEDFVALAQGGSFSRAAEARHIAQPAFSRHIRALEEWVGVDLFDRGAHPVALTAAGRRLQPLLEDILARLEAARIKAQAAQDLDAASLRFAATHMLSLTFFPRWLALIGTRLPLGPIQTLSDSLRACENLALQRRVQFILCHGHPDMPGRLDEAGYPMLRLEADELLPLSAADEQGRARHAIGRPQALPLLAYEEASGLGRIMRTRHLRLFRDEVDPELPQGVTVAFTAHHAVLLKAMALEGRGVAWLPRSLVQDELARGTLVAAGGAHWNIPVDIRLYRQPAAMAPAAEALWTLASTPAP